MGSLFLTEDNEKILERISKLKTDSQAQWGKMNVSQMLAHCNNSMHSALGELKTKRAFMGLFFGKIAFKQVVSDKPIKKGIPTDKKFKVDDIRYFDEEKKKLEVIIEKFRKAGPENISKDPHPFFGKLTPEQWDILMWRHLDHHLCQFGV